MYKHKTPETAVSWEIRDCSFSFTRGELCHVLLGKPTSFFLCLWCSRPVTAFKFMPVLFFSICKPGITTPVGNHFKVLRTPALETDRLCKSIQQGRGAGSGGGEVDGFTYNFLLSHLLYLHLLPHSVSTLSFKLCLITSMHFATYLPTRHFLKTIASPRKCNKTLQKEEAIVVWAGWL